MKRKLIAIGLTVANVAFLAIAIPWPSGGGEDSRVDASGSPLATATPASEDRVRPVDAASETEEIEPDVRGHPRQRHRPGWTSLWQSPGSSSPT